jgi:hypothetical protein
VTESATDPSVAFGDSSPQGGERLSGGGVADSLSKAEPPRRHAVRNGSRSVLLTSNSTLGIARRNVFRSTFSHPRSVFV